MKTRRKRQRAIPRGFYREFRAFWKNFVRIGEARFWTPHWTLYAPLSVRLERLGLDQEFVRWIIWWIDAFDKLERGEPLDRSTQPPKSGLHGRSQNEQEVQRIEGPEYGYRGDDANELRWKVWGMIWGPVPPMTTTRR
jgi:hypothetical protein